MHDREANSVSPPATATILPNFATALPRMPANALVQQQTPLGGSAVAPVLQQQSPLGGGAVYQSSAVDTNRHGSSYTEYAPAHTIGRYAENSNRSVAVDAAGCCMSPDASEEYSAASTSSARFASKGPETLP